MASPRSEKILLEKIRQGDLIDEGIDLHDDWFDITLVVKVERLNMCGSVRTLRMTCVRFNIDSTNNHRVFLTVYHFPSYIDYYQVCGFIARL